MKKKSNELERKEEIRMNKLTKNVEKEIIRIGKMLELITSFQIHEPQGCLKCKKRNGRNIYIHQYKDPNTKKLICKYIKVENIALARKLAQKQYYNLLKPVLEKNLEALRCFVSRYHPEEAEKVYDRLSDERKKLVAPIEDTKEERIRKWYAEEYEKNVSYPENLKFDTQQGEKVRSKSEVIIANLLYHCREDLLYKYECPVKLKIKGKIVIKYPDFKVMNIHTGKITYWEHAGMLDKVDYANDFVRKVNDYINNDMMPGRDIIFTCETTDNPLDIGVVELIVEKLREH